MSRHGLVVAVLTLVAATASLSSGCSSGSNSGGGGGVSCGLPCQSSSQPSATTVYATQINTYTAVGVRQPTASDQILSFSATANGAVTPSATLVGPVGYNFASTATDSAGNIYVVAVSASAGPITSEVLVYTAGSTGVATPARTISGSNTTFVDPHGIAVDSSGNIYVLDTSTFGPTIDVFSASANGNVPPTRFIRDSTTPSGGNGSNIAVDGSGNVYEMEYASPTRVVVFSSTANGSAAPIRTISGTELNHSSGVLTVDSAGDLYLATEDSTTDYAEIAYYPSTANGSSTPTRIIGGGAALGFQSFFNSIKVDSSGWVFGTLGVEPVFPTVSFSVVSYSPLLSGNVSPSATLTSTALTAGGSLALH